MSIEKININSSCMRAGAYRKVFSFSSQYKETLFPLNN
jgi:hypothetical protein